MSSGAPGSPRRGGGAASCDVLVVGGGPAGSSCARRLSQAGLDVLVLDRARFPRDKVCAGWVTPATLHALDFDADHYREGRTFQPITGFRTSVMGKGEVLTRYREPVSFGIRRCEFDDYLLRRSGARVETGVPLTDMRREPDGEGWMVNGSVHASVVVGAGGHFCPVARLLGAAVGTEPVVAAQEIEVPLDDREAPACPVRPEVPELFFTEDLKGYGWCFRKERFLNVGLGRLDRGPLKGHVASFAGFLAAAGKVPARAAAGWHGHAYLLYRSAAPRTILDDGVLLVGDAAGLAYAPSGEGIRTAIESGLLAAEVLLRAEGRYTRDRLEPYRARLNERYGSRDGGLGASGLLPAGVLTWLGTKLMATPWFARHVVLDRWFLHARQPALELAERPSDD
jgi:geranylgeranyl reductase family protein